MPDTIVQEPDTLAVDEAQSATVDQPELDDAEETAESNAVETESAQSAYEDEESASKDPVVARLLEAKAKDIEARLTQSFTDKQKAAVEKAEAQQRQQLFAQQATQAAQWRQGEAAKDIYGLLKTAEARINEGKSVDETWGELLRIVGATQQRIDQAAITQTFAAIQPIVNEALLEAFPDYTAPSNLAEAFYGAVHRYDPQAIFKTVMQIARDAARKDKALEVEVEGKIKSRIEGDRKVSSAQAASANRAGRTPTLDVPAGGAKRSMTLAQIDAMPTSEWLSMPKPERDRLLEEAHRKGR